MPDENPAQAQPDMTGESTEIIPQNEAPSDADAVFDDQDDPAYDKLLDKAVDSLAEGSKNSIHESPDDKAAAALGTQPSATLPTAPAQLAGGYTPNFFYTANGKQHEIPERFRSIITDSDAEKEVKDILSKASGLDSYKQRYGATKSEYDQYKESTKDYQKLQKAFDNISEALHSGNLNLLFKRMNVPKETINKYVREMVEYSNADPEVQKAYDAHQEREYKNMLDKAAIRDFQRQQQAEKEQMNTYVRNSIQNEIQTRIDTQPEYAAARQLVDQKLGEGGFLRAVNEMGANLYAKGYNVQPKNLIPAAINSMYKIGVLQLPNNTPTQTQPQPVIPNMQARQASAVTPIKTARTEISKATDFDKMLDNIEAEEMKNAGMYP